MEISFSLATCTSRRQLLVLFHAGLLQTQVGSAALQWQPPHCRPRFHLENLSTVCNCQLPPASCCFHAGRVLPLLSPAVSGWDLDWCKGPDWVEKQSGNSHFHISFELLPSQMDVFWKHFTPKQSRTQFLPALLTLFCLAVNCRARWKRRHFQILVMLVWHIGSKQQQCHLERGHLAISLVATSRTWSKCFPSPPACETSMF